MLRDNGFYPPHRYDHFRDRNEEHIDPIVPVPAFFLFGGGDFPTIGCS